MVQVHGLTYCSWVCAYACVRGCGGPCHSLVFVSTTDGDLELESRLKETLDNMVVHVAKHPLHISWALDKSRVGSRSVHNMMVATPDGVGFAAPPVVLL